MICKHLVKSEWAKPDLPSKLTYALLLASRVSASLDGGFDRGTSPPVGLGSFLA
jgi:hypothetical protein